jgi:hypothetical protein
MKRSQIKKMDQVSFFFPPSFSLPFPFTIQKMGRTRDYYRSKSPSMETNKYTWMLWCVFFLFLDCVFFIVLQLL